jgi:hypothetical protein
MRAIERLIGNIAVVASLPEAIYLFFRYDVFGKPERLPSEHEEW